MSNPSDCLEKENPGSVAVATGADRHGKSLEAECYRKRAEAATALAHAIRECEPEDAIILMEAALFGLRAGEPDPVFLSVMGEADEWAAFATVAERKAWCLASYNHLPAADRAAFLAHVTGSGHG